MKSASWVLFSIFVGILVFALNLGFENRISEAFATSSSKGSSKLKDPELEQRDFMIKISRQLGVTCIYCHDVNNFKDRSLATYKVSAEHIHMVNLLNQRSFTAKNGARADCYMCHRGKSIPDYKEPPTQAPDQH